ncbi:MAG: methanogenesis marker 3 protein [Methanoregula sp.]|uniref:methyl-coenzyme M reductase-associated protein Mmp3 n=1 Tax=Methanoregula sp. TaxID=2052170 RepID=UPI0025F70FC7|nr:methanogenesis marker 3 protein [Methanoregula sp.]MCK9631632.1 methanogenesis marker 3 protein [Methanoregula sp.]
MVTIHLDGKRLELAEGSRLSSILSDHPAGCAVAIIRPATQEQTKTANLAIGTTAGEITVEISGEGDGLPGSEITEKLALHWSDRYAAAFGPFPSAIHPLRKPHVYERGDVILGCGGYEPGRSYLIFAKTRHSADHGANESGGVLGKVVSGRGVLDRFTTGDRITKIEPVVSWADTSRSFTTTDPDLVLEEGMQVVTRIEIVAQGYTPDKISTEAAASVEHMLLALQSGRFTVGRATTTHVLDPHLAGEVGISREFRRPRLEGTVTVRNTGKGSGGVYIYRADVPNSPAHNMAGQVVHGIELVKLAKEHDVLSVTVTPHRISLLGRPLTAAKEIAAAAGITLKSDKEEGDRIIVSQEPGTTLDALRERLVTVTTAPVDKVIDIELDDAAAPLSCDVFRRYTGMKEHDAGMMPVFFKFDDVVLFKPAIAAGTKITPENQPVDEAPAATLAITNDSRKGAGLVGVRLSANKEFGPTSEPFEGTNIIGRVVDTQKLKKVKERETVYIREVRR